MFFFSSVVHAAMPTDEIARGIQSNDRALHILDGFRRDPYIILAPDDYYHLTGTTGGIPDGYDILKMDLKPCNAFYNGNIPPISGEDLHKRPLPATAYTINKMGTTLVPMEVKVPADGDIFIRAKIRTTRFQGRRKSEIQAVKVMRNAN